MMTSEELADFLRTIDQISAVTIVFQEEDSPANAVVATTLPTTGKEILLLFVLPSNFPNVLPKVVHLPENDSELLPHVIKAGEICYYSPEGSFINKMEPTSIIIEAFEKVVDILDKGISGENKWELISEFEAYWSHSSGEFAKSFIKLTDNIKLIHYSEIDTIYDDSTKKTFYDELEDVKSYYNVEKIGSPTIHNAIYIPLPCGTYCKPPNIGDKWDLEEFRKLINENIEKSQRKVIRRLLKGNKTNTRIVFTIPRNEGGKALFGVKFSDIVGDDHPFESNRSKAEVVPISLRRYDEEFVLPRGGANHSLSQKKVALVGCGAVGGYLALNLVRAGVLNITLIDNDELGPENVYRHVVGKYGSEKVYALQFKIERELPYTHIDALDKRFETLISDGTFDARNYDLIIIATGNDTYNREFNEKLHSIMNPPIIYTFVEGYDIGGHTLVTNINSKPGCFECLITDPSGEIVSNRAAFIKPDQVLTKDYSGCGSKFMPYGSYTAQKTALEAAKISVDVLLGKITSNSLFSWKGDDTELTEQKFLTSERYKLSQEQLNNQKDDYIVPSCRICGGNEK